MVLRSFFIAIAVLVLIFSCGDAAQQGPLDAKAIYEQKCSLCHGADGQLQLAQASDLSLSKLDLQARIQIITNGKNTMAPFKSVLSEQEIEAVAQYLETLRKP